MGERYPGIQVVRVDKTRRGLLMPRYFIDTSDGDTFVHDDEGYDLPDVRAARDAAQAALPDIARDKMPDGEKRTFCAFVRDGTGAVVYRVALSLVGEWSSGQEFS